MKNDEKAEFLSDLGLEEAGLARLIRAGYGLLDLLTFFTAGPKEARAWTIRNGATAPQAAGVIHTDFERGFIRAETIAYDDYLACNGESGAKDAGKLRVEGAEYLVVDGDVFHFRFQCIGSAYRVLGADSFFALRIFVIAFGFALVRQSGQTHLPARSKVSRIFGRL